MWGTTEWSHFEVKHNTIYFPFPSLSHWFPKISYCFSLTICLHHSSEYFFFSLRPSVSLFFLLSYRLLSVLICFLFLLLFLTLSLVLPPASVCLLSLPLYLCMSLSLKNEIAAQVLCRKATWSVISGQIKQIPGATADANFCLSACTSCLGGGSKTNTHMRANTPTNRNNIYISQLHTGMETDKCTHTQNAHVAQRSLFGTLRRADRQRLTHSLTHSLPAALISRMFSVQLNLISRRCSWFTRCSVMRESTFERH